MNHITILLFFFFNDTATTEIYTLSLHDALPISPDGQRIAFTATESGKSQLWVRSEEHTSELQSPYDLVCRLLLEKKKKNYQQHPIIKKKQKKKKKQKQE